MTGRGILLALTALCGCGRLGYEEVDAAIDGDVAPGIDSGLDGGPMAGDGGFDAGTDASIDGGPDPCAPPAGVCVWTGAVSSSVIEPSNWSACAGGFPQPGNRVFIDPSAPNAPVFDTPLEIRGFDGDGACSSTVTVGAELVLGDPDLTFTGSVTLVATFPTCVDCIVRSPGSITVRDGATLTVGSGIQIIIGDHARLEIGGPDTSGNFRTTGGGGPISEWPVLTSLPGTDPAHYGLRVRGGPGAPSSISLDGLVILQPHDIDGADHFPVDIGGHTFVNAIDHVHIESYYPTSERGFRIFDCTSLVVIDTNWSGIHLAFLTPAMGEDTNVAAMCDPGVRIQMTATGTGADPLFENDPTGVVDW